MPLSQHSHYKLELDHTIEVILRSGLNETVLCMLYRLTVAWLPLTQGTMMEKRRVSTVFIFPISWFH